MTVSGGIPSAPETPAGAGVAREGRGASLLVTCADLPPSVIGRLFVADTGWTRIVATRGGTVTSSDTALLRWCQGDLPLERLVILQHTPCPALHRTEQTVEAMTVTLDASLRSVAAELDVGERDRLQGFIYDAEADRIVRWCE